MMPHQKIGRQDVRSDARGGLIAIKYLFVGVRELSRSRTGPKPFIYLASARQFPAGFARSVRAAPANTVLQWLIHMTAIRKA